MAQFIKVHSVIDVITNSSSEIFISANMTAGSNFKKFLNEVIRLSSNGKTTYDDLFYPLAIAQEELYYVIWDMLLDSNEEFNLIPEELITACKLNYSYDDYPTCVKRFEYIMKETGYDFIKHLLLKDDDKLNRMVSEYDRYMVCLIEDSPTSKFEDRCDYFESGPYQYILLPKESALTEDNKEIFNLINSTFEATEFAT